MSALEPPTNPRTEVDADSIEPHRDPRQRVPIPPPAPSPARRALDAAASRATARRAAAAIAVVAPLRIVRASSRLTSTSAGGCPLPPRGPDGTEETGRGRGLCDFASGAFKTNVFHPPLSFNI